MAMDVGILQALKAVKNNPYVQYVGIGLAGLVADKEHRDQQTGAPQRKSKLELMRISAAVCGIELCYAAETAFVSPILLKLGVPASLMTLTWCLSPVLGFFLVPVMGSLSDRCRLRIGRRRPFIIIMSIGIVLGLGLVPNGEALGTLLGDQGNESVRSASGPGYTPPQMNETGASQKSGRDSFFIPSEHFWGIMFTILGVAMLDFSCDACQSPCRAYLLDVSVAEDHSAGLTTFTVMAGAGGSIGYIMGGIDWNSTHFGEILGGHIRVVFSVVLVSFIICIFFTLTSFRETPLSELGSVDPEIRKERSFKYTRFTDEDFSVEENIQEQPRISERRYKETSETANSNFQPTQDSTFHSQAKQSKTDIKTSEPEKCSGLIGIPGNELSPILTTQIEKLTKSQRTMPGFYQSTAKQSSQIPMSNSSNCCDENQMLKDEEKASKECIDALFHGTTKENEEINLYAINCTHKEHNDVLAISDVDAMGKVEISADVTLKTYLKSIIQMPRCMWVLCLCNLLCWMSLVCYSLYFTDFVGQSVFGGDPKAPVGSDLHNRYDAGVRTGSLGMSLYSLACACYSLTIERLVSRFRAKKIYVLGQLVFTVGMAGMAVSRSTVAVILLSPTAGVMYATLFTMPYLLVAHYHTRGLFSQGDRPSDRKQVRGLGTDVAIVSSTIFLAQFLLSVVIGTVVAAVNSPVSVIVASCMLSLLGSLTATKVTYLDL